MASLSRWEFIFNKALNTTSLSRAEILKTWGRCVAEVHTEYRDKIGAAETDRLAEVVFWKKLFPKDDFPDNATTWQVNSSNVPIPEHKLAAAGSLMGGAGEINHDDYYSMWDLVKFKAVRLGYPEAGLDRLHQDMSSNSSKTDQPARSTSSSRYSAELALWRALFPSEVFPGKHIDHGNRYFPSYDELYDTTTEEHRILLVENTKGTRLLLEAILKDNMKGFQNFKGSGNTMKEQYPRSLATRSMPVAPGSGGKVNENTSPSIMSQKDNSGQNNLRWGTPSKPKYPNSSSTTPTDSPLKGLSSPLTPDNTVPAGNAPNQKPPDWPIRKEQTPQTSNDQTPGRKVFKKKNIRNEPWY